MHIIKVLILLSLFICKVAIGQPQPKSYNVYLDLDNNSATGCTVLQPNFMTQFDGVDGYISATTGGASVAITGTLYHECSGGVFDAGINVVTSALGFNTNIDGHDVFEMQMASSDLGIRSSANVKLYFTAESGASSDFVIVNNNGGPIFAGVAFPIPVFSFISLLFLTLVIYIVAKKAYNNKTLVVASVLLFSTVVWGMFSFVIDGQVDDWSSFTPISDPLADNSAPGSFSDITQVFANLEQDLFTARIDVVDVENQAPTISSSATVSVAENQTAVIDVDSTDLDGDTEGAGLTYAITGGADNALFSIDANTGIMTFLTAPDFEMAGDVGADNDYNVQVTVTDSGGATNVQDIVVSVTNDLNDDATVAFQIATNSSADETTPLNVVIVLNSPVALSTALSVDIVDATGGTAVSATDYTAIGTQTVTFPIGAVNGATMNATLTPLNDNNIENDETVNLQMQNVSGLYALGTQITHTATITEDDTATVTFQSATGATADESAALSAPVLLTIVNGGQLDVAVTVDAVDATGGSATTGVDYTTFGTQLMTFPIGSINGAVQDATLSPIDDAANEGNETVNLALQNLTGPAAVTLGTQATYIATITDDEASVAFQASISSTNEDSLGLSVVVTLTTPVPLAAALSVDMVDAGGGSAVSGTDYTAIGTQTVTFPLGTVNGATTSVLFNQTNDNNVENNETANLQLQNLVGTGSIGTQSTHVMTIVEDDVATVQFQNIMSSTTNESTPLNVGIILSAPIGGQLNVPISVDVIDLGTGTATNTTDYSAFGTQTITFVVGSTNGNVQSATLTPLDDMSPEVSETINLQVQNINGSILSSLGTQTTHAVFITDDDNQPPTANNDAYAVTGNVGISVPVGTGVIFNDTDPNMDPLTVISFDALSAQGGSISVSANGSFTYTPPAGYIGSDSFNYTMTDGSVNDSATVNLTIADKIWFIDNSLAAAGNGTLGAPFNNLAAFEAINGNGAATQPAAGECIFIESGNYVGPLTLENTQTLVGKGSSTGIAAECGITLATNSMTLPTTGGTRPVITSAATAIDLASGNTLRGINVGNAMNKLLGNNFGTLTINEMTLTGTGKAVDLTTGIAAITFDSITTTSSTFEGIDINEVAGSFTVTGEVNVSSSTSQAILITNSTGVFSFTGNLNITSGGIRLNGNTSGSTTFSGVSKIINSGASLGINLNSNLGHSIRFLNGGLDIDATTGTPLNVIGSSLEISGSNNTLYTESGEIFNLSNATVDAEINSAIQNAGVNNKGIDLDNHTGILKIFGGYINNGGGNEAIELTGGSGAIEIATVVVSQGSGLAVDISGRSGGSITLSGNLFDSGTSQGGRVDISGNTGGTITLSGPTKQVNTSTSAAVYLANNTGATINFINGGLDIDTTSGAGFTAIGGGTIHVGEGTAANAINSMTGVAANISSTDIGASNVTFQSISTDGGTGNGIVLNTTGTSGSFIVTGNAVAGSGGIIANKFGGNGLNTAGIGIYLNNTLNPVFSFMQLNDFDNFAIKGTNVNGFNLINSVISGVSGNFQGLNEGAINFTNLLGSAAITSSNISGGFVDNIKIINQTGILDRLTVSLSTIGLNSLVNGNDGILFESSINAIANISVLNNSFLGARGDMVQCNAIDNSIMDCVIQGNQFNNTHANSLGGGVTISGGNAGSNIVMDYDVSGPDQTFNGAIGNAITTNFYSGNSIDIEGVIDNNIIGTSGIPFSGSLTGFGISLGSSGSTNYTHNVSIFGNVITNVSGQAGIDIATNLIAPAQLNTIINGNIVEQLGGAGASGFNANISGTGTTCIDFINNFFDATSVAGFGLRLEQSDPTANYSLPGYMGAPDAATADITAYLNGKGNINAPIIDVAQTIGVTGAACL